jgi:hypothetical protein
MLSEPDRRAAGDWGVELPPNVTLPVNYTISMKRVFELARQALERYPMLEAQALRVLWLSRYEEAWAHLQPSTRKGNPRAIEVGMRVIIRADSPETVRDRFETDPLSGPISFGRVRRANDFRQLDECSVFVQVVAFDYRIEGTVFAVVSEFGVWNVEHGSRFVRMLLSTSWAHLRGRV